MGMGSRPVQLLYKESEITENRLKFAHDDTRTHGLMHFRHLVYKQRSPWKHYVVFECD